VLIEIARLLVPPECAHVTFTSHDPADGKVNVAKFTASVVDVVPEPLTTTFFTDPKNVVLSAVGAAPNASSLYAQYLLFLYLNHMFLIMTLLML
jgi:hypothetical protein